MANRYWVGGSGTWNTTNTSNWSAASAVSFTASCSGTTLTTTGSPALVVGMTVWSSTNTSLGTITSGSGNTWTVSVGGTFASQTMKAATVGASIPTAADSVFFDANSSGTTAYTVTLTNALLCLDFNGTALTPTFATGASPSLAISGSMTIATGSTWSSTATITFNATTTGKTINTNGVSVAGAITFNGVGGGWSLSSALTVGSASTVTLTNGTLDLNGKTLTCGLFSSSNANVRTLAFGTGNITLGGAGGTLWTTATITNLTVTGTPVVNVSYSGSVATTINTGALSEANSISFNFTTGTYALTFLGISGYTARDVNFTGFAGTLNANSATTIYGSLTISTGMTLTASNSAITFGATSGIKAITSNGKTVDFPLNFNGAGGTWQLQDALTLASTRSVTLTSGTLDINSKTLTSGFFSSSNVITRTLAFGTGNITLNGAGGTLWNTSTPTNMTVTGTPTVNISYSGALATTVTPGNPVEANSVSFNFTTGTYALTMTSGSWRDLNFTGFAGTMNAPNHTIYGNLNTGTAFVGSGATVWTFASTSGTKTITTNGTAINANLTFNGIGGTWQLLDALTAGGTPTLTQSNGKLDLNGKTLTTGAYATGVGVKNLTFNGGTLALTADFTNSAPTGYTTTAGIGSGTIALNSLSTQTFAGGGSTYNCAITKGTNSSLVVTGANTFDSFTCNIAGSALSLTFPAGATNTFITSFQAGGNATFRLNLISSSPGTQATLSKASGTVSVSYCAIQDIAATGGATWNALLTNGNLDNGNNTGWNFAGSGTQNLTQTARLNNVNTFYGPTLRALYAITQTARLNNSNTFYSATVRATISLTQTVRFDNANTFYAASLSRSVTLTQTARFNNANTFYAATVVRGAVTLTQTARFNNSNTFYSATVRATTSLTQTARFNNSNTFYSATVRASISLAQTARFDNANTFYSATIVRGTVTLSPSRYNNQNTFFAASLAASVTLSPSRYNNQNTFFTARIANIAQLRPARFDNTNTFYSATVRATISLTQIARFDNANTFFSARLVPGPVGLFPSRLNNVNVIYPVALYVSNTLRPALFVNQNVFYPETITGGSPTPLPWHPHCQHGDMQVQELPRQDMTIVEAPRQSMTVVEAPRQDMTVVEAARQNMTVAEMPRKSMQPGC